MKTWQYGVFVLAEDGRAVCHECRRAFHHLGGHVVRAHDMTAESYKQRHGLKASTGLISPALADHRRQLTKFTTDTAKVPAPHRGRRIVSEQERRSRRMVRDHATGRIAGWRI
jgi:hypothetical protein